MKEKDLQIGVMGSMADVELQESCKNIAIELGREIAKRGYLLVYGFEGDFSSLPVIAAKECEKNGGMTLAFLWGKKGADLGELNSIRVETGQLRGGGREFPLILSSDAIICLGGGSGTLTEIAMAYQAAIPVVVIKGTGGWSEKLAGMFLDERKRTKILLAKNSKGAIELAIAEKKNLTR